MMFVTYTYTYDVSFDLSLFTRLPLDDVVLALLFMFIDGMRC